MSIENEMSRARIVFGADSIDGRVDRTAANQAVQGDQDATKEKLKELRAPFSQWYAAQPHMAEVFDQIIANGDPAKVMESLQFMAVHKWEELDGVKNPPPETASIYTVRIFMEAIYFALETKQLPLASRLRGLLLQYQERDKHMTAAELEMSVRRVARSVEHAGFHSADREAALKELFELTY